MIRKLLSIVGAWFLVACLFALVWMVIGALGARRARCRICLTPSVGRYYSRMGRVCGPCLDAIFRLNDRPRRRFGGWYGNTKPIQGFDGDGWRNG